MHWRIKSESSNKSFQYGGNTVTLEVGRIARQATGAVLVTIENTSVLVTVVAQKTAKEGQDFFRSQYIIKKKAYAVGKIPEDFLREKVVLVKKKHSHLG